MEILLKVVHSIDASLLALLSSLAKGEAPAAGNSAAAPAPPKKQTTKPTKVEEVVEEVVEEEVVEEDLDGGDDVQPTLELVRQEAQKLMAGGKSVVLKGILKKYGAAKVVDLETKNYAAFLKDVREKLA